ncbi:MAG: TrbG/VirB9 family P-type conjugative transfer protein [Phycisphaerae bacterium]|jgi:type IV secretion system protein VirB9
MKYTKTSGLLVLILLLPCSGCFLARPTDGLVVYRRPWQMIDSSPVARPPRQPPDVPTASDTSQNAATATGTTKRRVIGPNTDRQDVTPAEAVEAAREDATQQPTPEGFIDAVQVYDYEPGAVYEVLTAPGFVTVLRLRPGEQVQNLAAGDTSRWLIDTVAAGVVDPQAVLSDDLLIKTDRQPDTRLSVLIKPRRPALQTNLVVTTSERTYLIDLKSVETTAYHSVVEWTYPHAPTNSPPVAPSATRTSVDSDTRNYAYLIKVPHDHVPRWTPVCVFDDGHRVYVRFPDHINDVRRPPLFIVDPDGAVRLVNYHVEDRSYVVHELFDRAELRLGAERVIIDRVKPKRPSLLGAVADLIGIGD